MRLTSNQRASKTGLVQKIDRCGGERGLPVDSGFRDFSKCFFPANVSMLLLTRSFFMFFFVLSISLCSLLPDLERGLLLGGEREGR